MKEEKTMKEIEYSDSCPECKSKMQGTDKKNKEQLIYYCWKCKQKYRIDVIHKSQEIECPYCKKKILIDKDTLSNLHFNSLMNFFVRKTKIK